MKNGPLKNILNTNTEFKSNAQVKSKQGINLEKVKTNDEEKEIDSIFTGKFMTEIIEEHKSFQQATDLYMSDNIELKKIIFEDEVYDNTDIKEEDFYCEIIY